MGRQTMKGNQFPPNNKLVQDPEGNKENRCPDSYSKKTKINYAKGRKNTLKEELL
jgi:hypothetical protein